METKTKKEILETSLAAREQEVLYYQINIDNYTLALNAIDAMSAEERAELSEFAGQLRNLLTSEKFEQKKAKLMLSVVKQQLE